MAEVKDEIPFDRLPAGFADTLDEPPEEIAEPLPAATVVLMKDGDDGPEVLLLRRNRKMAFVPGAYVFPGGRVDRADWTEAVLDRVDGLDPERAHSRLGIERGSEPRPQAYWVAALREAYEETGILVSRGAPVLEETLDRHRDDLLDERVSFSHILDVLNNFLDANRMEYIAHWITPEVEPRRYDTRFFLAIVPDRTVARPDPRETADHLWIRPEEAVKRQKAGDLPMVFPTLHTLQALSGFDTAKDALEHFEGRRVKAILPRLVKTPTGVGLEVD